MAEIDAGNALERMTEKKSALLLVDSDKQHLMYTSQLLQRFEYLTRTAMTGREALESTAAASPALIITAVGLLDMSGLNLIRLFKKNPITEKIPCITMRSQEDPINERDCYTAGAKDCLAKPVTVEPLYRIVQSAVEKTPRATIRLRAVHPVKVDTAPFDGHAGMHTLALSERGMFLHSTKQVPVQSQIALRMNLNGLIIPADAKVLYNGLSRRGSFKEPGMGLEFIRIAPKDQEYIRKYIRSEVTRGIPPVNSL
jgi:CheY-like chemotaxis protein